MKEQNNSQYTDRPFQHGEMTFPGPSHPIFS
jgi:hypothetical protein